MVNVFGTSFLVIRKYVYNAKLQLFKNKTQFPKTNYNAHILSKTKRAPLMKRWADGAVGCVSAMWCRGIARALGRPSATDAPIRQFRLVSLRSLG